MRPVIRRRDDRAAHPLVPARVMDIEPASLPSKVPALLSHLAAPVVTAAQLPWKWLLLIVVWAVPTVFSALFLYIFASDQYISEFRFNLRSSSIEVPSAAGGNMMSGGGGTTTLAPTVVWDSYVIAQFIKSQDVVAEIDKRIGFKKIYRPNNADFFFRFGSKDSLESMTEYWRSVADPFFDVQTGIISVKIRAFSPEDSLRVAQLVLELAENTVNDMSERARQDALSFARSEVASAEQKLREAQLAVRNFRDSREIIDPQKEAEQSMLMLGRQKEELGKLRSELEATRGYLDATSPAVRVLKSRIAAVELAIQEEQKRVVTRSGPAGEQRRPNAPAIGSPGDKQNSTLSYALTDFETLMFEQTFRERSYALAQESLQKARMEADKKQLYLNAFVKPRKPETSLFPQREKLVLIIAFGALVMWGLICLVVYSIRDHV